MRGLKELDEKYTWILDEILEAEDLKIKNEEEIGEVSIR